MPRVTVLPHELRNLGADAAETVRRELATPLRAPRAKRGTGKASRRKLAAATGAPVQVPPGDLLMPWPPSVNHYWILGRGGFRISERGVAYKAAVRAAVAERLLAKIATPWFGVGSWCDVTITLWAPDHRKRDADNLPKAIFDALKGLLWEDDSAIRHFSVGFAGVAAPGAVVVRAVPCGQFPKGGAR